MSHMIIIQLTIAHGCHTECHITLHACISVHGYELTIASSWFHAQHTRWVVRLAYNQYYLTKCYFGLTLSNWGYHWAATMLQLIKDL